MDLFRKGTDKSWYGVPVPSWRGGGGGYPREFYVGVCRHPNPISDQKK